MNEDELMDRDPGYEEWAHEMELEHQRECANETMDGMRETSPSRDDLIKENDEHEQE